MINSKNVSDEYDRLTALAKQRKKDAAAQLKELKKKRKQPETNGPAPMAFKEGIVEKLMGVKDPLFEVLFYLNEKVKNAKVVKEADIPYNVKTALHLLKDLLCDDQKQQSEEDFL